jgi:hypothetical protein
VHRTFLEYFAAAQLVKRKPEAPAVWQHLSDRIGEASWTVVAQMAVQILDRDCQDGATHLLELVLDEAAHLSRHTDDSRQLHLLRFSTQCLNNVAPDNTVIRRLAEVCRARARAPHRTRRGLHRYALSQRLENLDTPLSWLLQVQAPDNSTRIGRAIGESLQAMTSTRSSAAAGLLAAMLLHNARDTPSPTLTAYAKALKALPTPARTWTRVLRNPSTSDLARYGFQSLYKWTIACGAEHRPLAYDLLYAGFVQPLTSADAVSHLTILERLHDRIFHAPIPFDFLTQPGDWYPITEALTIKRLISVPNPRARAATTALMLPLLQPGLPRLPDFDCKQLIAARRHHQPHHVDRLLKQLQLPPTGDRLLHEWLATPLPKRHSRSEDLSIA